MVKINLISLENDIATVMCLPEGSEENKFSLILDLKNQSILKNSLNKKGNPHAIHASWKMYDEYMANGSLPESSTVIWC